MLITHVWSENEQIAYKFHTLHFDDFLLFEGVFGFVLMKSYLRDLIKEL